MLVPVASSADECHLLDVDGKSGGTDLAQGLHPRLPPRQRMPAPHICPGLPTVRAPVSHWKKPGAPILWSGVFPISAAQLRLAGAFLVQTHHEWQVSVGRVRANSAVDLLISSIAGAPVLTAGAAATLIGRSYPQANAAIQRLASAGILSPTNVGRRNRAFEATEIINAFTDLERRAQQDSSVCGHSHGRHG